MGIEATQRHSRDDLSIIGGGGVILVEHGAMDNARASKTRLFFFPPKSCMAFSQRPAGSYTVLLDGQKAKNGCPFLAPSRF
jgi:hypothetical protein